MNVPSGYSEIGMIGYTDRGDYASNVTYVKNDLVHYSGGVWRCLIDDTTGVEPREGVNWTIFVQLPESAAESLIAPIESDTGASERAYAIGERLILNDTLYKAKTAISVGDELVVNTNIELAGNVSTQLDGKADKTNAFLTNDTAETALADNDTVPFYDTSASSKRKTTWSNIVAKIKASLSKSDVGLGNVPNVSTNNQTPTFSQASSRANIASGEKLSTIFGKIMKVIADLKAVAFSGAYSDLSGKPTKLSQFDNDSQYLKFIGFFPNGTSMNDQPDGIYQTSPNNLPTELANVESTYGINKYGQLFNQKQGHTHTTYVDVFGNKLTWGSNTQKWALAYSTEHKPFWGDIQSKPSSFTPTSHASSDTGYGAGNASNYGHVKLSDFYTSNLGAAANSLGASQMALHNVYSQIPKVGFGIDEANGSYLHPSGFRYYTCKADIPKIGYYLCTFNVRCFGDGTYPEVIQIFEKYDDLTSDPIAGTTILKGYMWFSVAVILFLYSGTDTAFAYIRDSTNSSNFSVRVNARLIQPS